MTPDTIFQLSNSIALTGWLILIFITPIWMETDKLLIGIVVTLFAILYSWLLFQSFSLTDFEQFSTLDGLMSLFTSKTAVTAGWVHYLAFDLMVGNWIVHNARKYHINHWLITPCLLCTFMAGPFGLLLYLLIRLLKTRHYFVDNF
jgi:hypothetical protein